MRTATTTEQVLDIVRRLERTTVREIGAELGLAPSSVWWHLESLRERGAVTWDAGKARTIRAVKYQP